MTGGPVGPEDSVRAVLAAHPSTAGVFERHGLQGCGGSAGPDERIDVFATAHRIEVGALLRELNAAVVDGVPAAPVRRGRPPAERPLYPAFLRAAFACTLTLGATFGAYNLLVIHWALGANPPSHNWVHAGFQVWGFVLLSIMGVSSHALPRFLGAPLAFAPALRASLWLTLGAQVLLGWGRLGERLPWTVPATALGAALQFAAVSAWAAALGATWRRSKARLEPYLLFLAVGTAAWLAAAACLVGGAVEAVREADAEAAVGWNQAVYALALFGGTLPWVQGFFLRVGPAFLGLGSARRGWVVAALVLGPAGAAAAAFGSLRIGKPGGLALMDAGLLAVVLSVAAYVVGVNPFARARTPWRGDDRLFRNGVRAAFGGALLFAALGGLYGAWNLADGSAPGLLHDGARHAFTVGFVTILVVSLAARVLPVFTGAELRRPRLLGWGLTLIAAGAVLREAQVVAALLASAAPLAVSGASGAVSAVGLGLAAVSLLGTLRAAGRPERAGALPSHAPVSADVKVGDLLDGHPELLPLLIEAGFAPLANPVMRRLMGRTVTLRAACAIKGVELEPLLDRLRQACAHAPPPAAESRR